MPCNDPLVGWKATKANPNGKRSITFRLSEGCADLPVSVRCGKCAGCILERAREWATRCEHEAQMWPENSYVTLTYDEKCLPMVKGVVSLRPRDFILFMKRLRKSRPGKVRFFQCGEYGGLAGRPHHHALLFNCSFADKYVWTKRDYGPVYRSSELERLWPFGYCEIGEVCFQTAGYVARYTMKKAGTEFNQFGESRIPSYLTMSRRPGIGADWYAKFKGDLYPRDECIVSGGRKFRVPRYYDDLLERENPELRAELQRKRVQAIPEEVKSGLRQVAREVILRKRISESLRRA